MANQYENAENLFPLASLSLNPELRGAIPLVREYKEVTIAIASNTGDAEVPTVLDEVLGIEPIGYCDEFSSGDSLTSLSTDGVITAGAITVRAVTASYTGAPTDHTFRFWILGKLFPKNVT